LYTDLSGLAEKKIKIKHKDFSHSTPLKCPKSLSLEKPKEKMLYSFENHLITEIDGGD